MYTYIPRIHPPPLEPPSHTPYPTPLGDIKHRADLPVLCGSLPLAILHLVVYICQCYSLTTSLSPLAPCVLKSVLYICVFIPALSLVRQYHFSRFHIYVLAYGICFSLSDLLRSVWQTLGPTTSLQITQFCSFLWLSNTPLYRCATSPLSIHLSMDI